MELDPRIEAVAKAIDDWFGADDLAERVLAAADAVPAEYEQVGWAYRRKINGKWTGWQTAAFVTLGPNLPEIEWTRVFVKRPAISESGEA